MEIKAKPEIERGKSASMQNKQKKNIWSETSNASIVIVPYRRRRLYFSGHDLEEVKISEMSRWFHFGDLKSKCDWTKDANHLHEFHEESTSSPPYT